MGLLVVKMAIHPSGPRICGLWPHPPESGSKMSYHPVWLTSNTPPRMWLTVYLPPRMRKENVALPIMWLANNTHMAFDMWLASNTPPRNWGTISNEWTRWGHTGAAAGGDVQPRALFSLLTNESDYEAKPSVLLLGQYSTSTTCLLKSPPLPAACAASPHCPELVMPTCSCEYRPADTRNQRLCFITLWITPPSSTNQSRACSVNQSCRRHFCCQDAFASCRRKPGQHS